MSRAWLLAALLAGACGDDALSAAGQPCASSEECAAGLVCDFTHTPHTCQPTQTISHDMARARDAAIPDSGPDDLQTHD